MALEDEMPAGWARNEVPNCAGSAQWKHGKTLKISNSANKTPMLLVHLDYTIGPSRLQASNYGVMDARLLKQSAGLTEVVLTISG
jgi:hypothetical protein